MINNSTNSGINMQLSSWAFTRFIWIWNWNRSLVLADLADPLWLHGYCCTT